MSTMSPNSAFFTKLQGDNVELCEIMEVTLPNGSTYYWTTCNAPLTYTLSGTPREYLPFPGNVPTGVQEDNQLTVSVIDFILQNTISAISDMLQNTDFSQALVTVGQVFTDTPDLGRMEVYRGQVGDFTDDRLQIKGQARNLWKSFNINWPYYSYADECGWRFGSFGCGFDTSSISFSVTSLVVNSSTTIDLMFPAGTISNSFPPGALDFGRITIYGGANSGSLRTIRAQTGDLVSLSRDLPSADFTTFAASIYPGCRKRIIDDCKSRYNNTRNALSFWTIPVQENAF